MKNKSKNNEGFFKAFYKNAWNKMYAIAVDSTGKKYKSNKTKEKPEWAK